MSNCTFAINGTTSLVFSSACSEHDEFLLNVLFSFNNPDQDMAGLGALIGFLSAGVLTQFFSLLLHRLKDCKSHTLRHNGGITKTNITYRTFKYLAPAAVDDPLQFWINLVSAFLVGLSDQQLLVGLLVLGIITATQGASMSMLMAQWISFFTLITHAATFASLRPYFRRYKWLTLLRVMVMITAYSLFIFVNITIFKIMREIENMPLVKKSPQTVADFQGYYEQYTTVFYIEVGIMSWIYLSMVPALFISDELVKVRKAIARWPLNKEDLSTSAVSDWLEKRKMANYSTSTDGQTRRISTTGGILSAPHAMFCRLFLRTKSKPVRVVLWLVAEIFFPWALLPGALLFLFTGLLGYICLQEYELADKTLWTFGQILPIAMVGLPFWALVQNYYEEKVAAQDEKKAALGDVVDLSVESKTWTDRLGNSMSVSTGDGEIAEPEYRPRSRQFQD